MSTGLPNERSVFEHRSINDIHDEVRDVYLRYPQPWVIGYSGGKDSTTVLQIVWEALRKLPTGDRTKPVYVIAADTLVETPVIVNHIGDTLMRINAAAKELDMPFRAVQVSPALDDTFWVNLIGRGYPAPTTRFRWCTERMKIKPADSFIQGKVAEHGEVIVVLGIRKSESATRMQLMNTYELPGHPVLRRHASLTGAYVYAPIAEFSTADVWSYLLQAPSPWGGSNRGLVTLYRNASGGECPLVIDTTTPSCGNSRFGCWVCTVAQRDLSMEALVENGEEWMEPLLRFREWLAKTTDPHHKREFRDIKGRDGRIILKKDGTPAARTYKLDVSKQMLEELLKVQLSIRNGGTNPDAVLIRDVELHEIRRIWRTERQDWDDSVPEIYRRIMGSDLEWPYDDDATFDTENKVLLMSACAEYAVPFDLVAKMLQEERRAAGMARRSGIQKALDAVLGQEWRSEEELLSAVSEQLRSL